MMQPRYWLLTVISTILIVTLTISGVNVMIDVYGLYWPARGRRLPVFGDERVSKYLLSMRYVPENFDAILSGASVSANWDVTKIKAVRVYNGSLDGGSIVEAKAMIEAALDRPGISTVLLVVHPALTYSHNFQTVELNPSLKRSALGSWSLWSAYKGMANIWLRRMPQTFDYAGTETFLNARSEMNINMRQMWSAPEFALDPVALQAYRDLVAKLRARGIQLVFIVPPTSEQLLQTKREPLEKYLQEMREQIGTKGLWIDFLSPEYTNLCARANFSDGVHLTSDGALKVVAQINIIVSQWIANRQLVVAHP